jgi:iron complex outermembrane receptor protein
LLPSESYSNELLFATNGSGPLSLIAGFFLYRENASGDQILNDYVGSVTPGGFRVQKYDAFTDSYAGFASVNFDMTDQLHISAGARYTYDKKRQPENRVKTSQKWMRCSHFPSPNSSNCKLRRRARRTKIEILSIRE